MKIRHEILTEIGERIKHKKEHPASVIREYAQQLQVHETSIRRALKKEGIYLPNKKAPRTKGIKKTEITQAELFIIANFKNGSTIESLSGTKLVRIEAAITRNQLPTKRAIELLYKAGKIKRLYPAGSVNRWIREMGGSLRQQKKNLLHIDLLSKEPNHLWQYDTTTCRQVLLPDGKFYFVAEGELYKNKDTITIKGKKEKPEKIFRFAIVDHYSHCFYIQYYNAENAVNFQKFFWEACSPKTDLRHPMRGVPEILYTDKAPEVKAAATQRILERLGVRHLDHFKKNSKAKGSVETLMRFWEANFESLLKFQPAQNFEEINRQALQVCAELNSKNDLERSGMIIGKRASIYRNYLDLKNLRKIPSFDVYSGLASADKEVFIRRNGIIRFKTKEYYIGADFIKIHGGKKLMARYSAYMYPNIEVELEPGKFIILEPVEHDAVGRRLNRSAMIGEEFVSQPESLTTQTLKAAAKTNSALASIKPLDITSAEGIKHLIPEGADIEITAEETYLNKATVKNKIYNYLGRDFTDAEVEQLEALPSLISVKETKNLCTKFKEEYRASIRNMG